MFKTLRGELAARLRRLDLLLVLYAYQLHLSSPITLKTVPVQF
jgi:hypothetical protein